MSSSVKDELENISRPLRGGERDLDPVLDAIGERRFVLLGEASHGTAEYYAWRASLTRRLIREKGFSFVGVEGDWPDCYRITRYVKGLAGRDARAALRAFQRWPTWMWANAQVAEFIEWLREHNAGLDARRRVGFFGLDVYSLWSSLYALIAHLQKSDTAALPAARRVFHCFEPHAEDAGGYALATLTLSASCEDEVVALLTQMRTREPHADGDETRFDAEQNALVVQSAERYYRMMVRGDAGSWNVRDRHMVETLDRLMLHHGEGAKAVVWMHNTHIGDARFTDMAGAGMVNVGQLVREQHGEHDVFLLGFGSYEGEVIAGRGWEAACERMTVPPARAGSWEHAFHENRAGDQLVLFGQAQGTPTLLAARGHRAIGVVYRAERELGNYVPTVLPRRYDAFVHLDRTSALDPLHVPAGAEGEVPETYPSGM